VDGKASGIRIGRSSDSRSGRFEKECTYGYSVCRSSSVVLQGHQHIDDTRARAGKYRLSTKNEPNSI
jgi:hypothetical protein